MADMAGGWLVCPGSEWEGSWPDWDEVRVFFDHLLAVKYQKQQNDEHHDSIEVWSIFAVEIDMVGAPNEDDEPPVTRVHVPK